MRGNLIFKEGRIGTLLLKNRIIMAAMGTNFAGSNGEVTESMMRYYARRAKGGVGLITVENCNVSFPLGRNGATQLRLDEDSFIPGMAALREAIYLADPQCKVSIQINHAGGQTKSARIQGNQIVSAGDIPAVALNEKPRPLTIQEIKQLVDNYAQTALRAKKAGFDAVEVHGAYGYLIAQFLSPKTNNRTDEYGGSSENRARFAVEIVKKIKEVCGKRFPVIFRLNAAEFVDGGLEIGESKEYAMMLEKAGTDMLNITAGSGYTSEKHIEPMNYEQGWKAYLAGEIKKVVSIPVAAVGVIREPQVAEDILEKGEADFIVLGRPLIADPDWPLKVASGKPFNHCIVCNLCIGRRAAWDVPLRCSVNPIVGNEVKEDIRILTQIEHKKVLIVGGGPGGMRAAIEAAKDGHEVILLERKDRLGGKSIIASVPPFKQKVRWLTEDLIRSVNEAGVTVRLNIEADMETIDEIKPDVVILATGSDAKIPDFFDISPNMECIIAEDLLFYEHKPTGKKIAVIGGGSVGCETAEYLADSNQVIVLEMLSGIANDADPISRGSLIRRLAESEIKIYQEHQVLEVKDSSVLCNYKGNQVEFDADIVVFAMGTREKSTLPLEELSKRYQTITIGDCSKAGRFYNANWDAYVAVARCR